MITLKCTEKEVINIIEQYYKQKEGRNVTASISAERGFIGLYETEGCITTIKIKEEIEFLGMKKEVEISINKNELEEILNILLDENGYIVKNIIYDTGLSGDMFDRPIGAYFRGITLEIDNKKKKTLSRNRNLNNSNF